MNFNQSILLLVLFCAIAQFSWIQVLKTQWGHRLFSDVPNERSSHISVVPRGGGVAFALVILTALATSLIYVPEFWVNVTFSMVAFVMLATVSFIDDLYGLQVKTRFVFHLFCSALIALPVVNQTAPQLQAFHVGVFLLLVVYGAAAINFMNFADGINGYIGLIGIINCLSIAIFYLAYPTKPNFPLFLVSIGLLVSLSVFLYFNVFRKQVFMGDVGSTTLGLLIMFTLSGILISNAPTSIIESFAVSLASWWVVWVDCGSMVVAKLFAKYPLSKAHREHIYQRLSRRPGWTHAKVAFGLFALQALSQLVFMGLIRNGRTDVVLGVLLILLLGGCWSNYTALKVMISDHKN